MMNIGPEEIAQFSALGFAATHVADALLAPMRRAAAAVSGRGILQDRLSGLHNPFGGAAQLVDSWALLDLAENCAIADAAVALIGPDVILWDSELYLDRSALQAAWRREGRHWPVVPLRGLIAILALAAGEERAVFAEIGRICAGEVPLPAGAGPAYAIRYMPATSRFDRDPRLPANRLAAEERPLVNYAKRPIWLIRGEDRAGNDFVTGFSSPAAAWAAPIRGAANPRMPSEDAEA